MGVQFQPYYKLKVIDLSDNTQVNSGGATNTQTLQPASGKIYEIVGIWVSIPAIGGGASGNHDLTCKMQNQVITSYYHFKIIGSDGGSITINYYLFQGNVEAPGTTNEQFKITTNGTLYCSNSQPIDFVYTNDSDTNQTGNRAMEVWVKEYNEMS